MNFFSKKPTPKEQAMKAKRETRREVRVSLFIFDVLDDTASACGSELLLRMTQGDATFLSTRTLEAH